MQKVIEFDIADEKFDYISLLHVVTPIAILIFPKYPPIQESKKI